MGGQLTHTAWACDSVPYGAAALRLAWRPSCDQVQAEVTIAWRECFCREDEGGTAPPSCALAGLDFPAGLWAFVFDPLER